MTPQTEVTAVLYHGLERMRYYLGWFDQEYIHTRAREKQPSPAHESTATVQAENNHPSRTTPGTYAGKFSALKA